MKPIKCWIAQDLKTKYCFIYHTKPKLSKEVEGEWGDRFTYGYAGDNLLSEEELKLQPLECKITVIKPKENK